MFDPSIEQHTKIQFDGMFDNECRLLTGLMHVENSRASCSKYRYPNDVVKTSTR